MILVSFFDRKLFLALGMAAVGALVSSAAERKFTDADLAFFDKQVKPALVANCIKCHGGDNLRGNLR